MKPLPAILLGLALMASAAAHAALVIESASVLAGPRASRVCMGTRP